MADERKELTVIDAPQTNVEFKNEFDVSTILSTAGKLTYTEEQVKALFAPIDDDAVEIRPDGLVYGPWEMYLTRLRQAFPLKFAFIPQGMPKIRPDGFVVWGFWLVIDGVLMGYAIGENKYQESNATMTETDACEGAKSNAKMRLCKDLGMFPEMWTPSWIRAWKEKYAESYTIVNKRGEQETRWQRKGSSRHVAEGEKVATPGEYVLPFKKAKEMTGKEKPTLQEIFDVGKGGIDYLRYIAGWDEAKQATRDAINAFLKEIPEGGAKTQPAEELEETPTKQAQPPQQDALAAQRGALAKLSSGLGYNLGIPAACGKFTLTLLGKDKKIEQLDETEIALLSGYLNMQVGIAKTNKAALKSAKDLGKVVLARARASGESWEDALKNSKAAEVAKTDGATDPGLAAV